MLGTRSGGGTTRAEQSKEFSLYEAWGTELSACLWPCLGSLAAEQVNCLGLPNLPFQGNKTMDRRPRCTPSSALKGEESILASRAECKISQDTMWLEPLPLLSRGCRIKHSDLETMSRRTQLSSFGRCPSPSTKEKQAGSRLKERLLVAKEGTGTAGGGQGGRS